MRRQEEKTAREVAAEERRKALENDRQTKLADMTERNRKRDAQLEATRCKQESTRLKTMQDKARLVVFLCFVFGFGVAYCRVYLLVVRVLAVFGSCMLAIHKQRPETVSRAS